MPNLLDYLQQLQRQGQRTVAVDDEARSVLRELYTRGSARKRDTSSSSATTIPQPASTQLSPVGETPAEKLASIASQATNWPPARALGTLREKFVFSHGDSSADLMLVGEAPGFQEEKQAQPFVGPAGQKLDQILKAMGLGRDLVYLSNVCKFRPATANQTTNNRKPSPDELAANLPILKAEIEVVRPKVIIALGASAAETLRGASGSLASMRDAWHQFQGIPLRVTYHPSYLLRQQDGLAEKRKVWEDMLAVMEKLTLPISAKQREFFK